MPINTTPPTAPQTPGTGSAAAAEQAQPTWPSFTLLGTAGYKWPSRAIRDGGEVLWEERNDPTDNTTRQHRPWNQITYHVDVNSASIGADTAFFAWLDQPYQKDIKVYVGSGAKQYYVNLYDYWAVERVNWTDHGNGCATLWVTVKALAGTWTDLVFPPP